MPTIVIGIFSFVMDALFSTAKRVLLYGVVIGLMIAIVLFGTFSLASNMIH